MELGHRKVIKALRSTSGEITIMATQDTDGSYVIVFQAYDTQDLDAALELANNLAKQAELALGLKFEDASQKVQTYFDEMDRKIGLTDE